jgi:hypothetical protein
VKKKSALQMSLEQADAHQRKHGFPPLVEERCTCDHSASDVIVDQRCPLHGASKTKKTKKLRTAREMNQTEREFSFILEAQKTKGEIVRWVFEGVTLKWGGGMRYKPDFFVLVASGVKVGVQRIGHFRCVEVKGAKIWPNDITRFKGARAEWPEIEFEMHQKLEGAWNRLL